MIISKQEDVTGAVIGAMSGAPNDRLRTVMASFVRHVHAFAREVRLTEAEFEFAIDFLNRIGQATNDAHNEAVLFSDAIGLSTLVCLLNNGQDGASETAAALLGPFWRANAPQMENGASILRSPTPGAPLFVDCNIRDGQGRPMSNVRVDVWQASPSGMYENQDAGQADMNLRGVFISDENGRFSFRSVKPAGYPVPTDGPTGEMLAAQKRHPYRPAHLHVLAYKPGFKTLITQVFVDDDQHLESDVVFGVTRALIGDFRKGQGTPPAPDVDGDWFSLNYTFVMEPGEAVLPHPPIK
ncbi:catechol 1,2-dioxygenase [Rhodopseudomonas sp. P2A-2r]|uniref:dioxygenase family protein n=1 Tax=Rhodopseudomonas sp. P2A-2r TaxID=2991972 RepID=UPI002234C4B5|nr:dioxygenase [Rhodopseudomonas sp. P2A-2r]UZE52077.1 catechol 1,2-dioxygenase [Rhodopseudomonas sp. P2A-2r]